MANRLFTLGHSVMEWSVFMDLLRQFDIHLLVDVRSRPQSSRFPQFDRNGMENSLER
jgi:uncharacterized protein (DUF488 family)